MKTNLEVPRLTLPCNDQTVTGSEKEMNILNFSQSSKHNEEAINYIKVKVLLYYLVIGKCKF